jgi:hypothetical protein
VPYDIEPNALLSSSLGAFLMLSVATALYAGGVLLAASWAVRRRRTAPERAKPTTVDDAAVVIPSGGFW